MQSNVRLDDVFEAIKTRQNTTLHEYLREGGEIEARDCSGWTLLMAAVAHLNIEAVQELVSRGASIRKRDYAGFTAKDHARLARSPHLLEILARPKQPARTMS